MYVTVVELPEYLKRVDKLLSQRERDKLVYFLSTRPKAGVLLQGTGGIRKLRWTREGKGKSGGVRVIYFFYNENIPLFLLTIFAKGEMADLNKTEKNELAKLSKILKDNY